MKKIENVLFCFDVEQTVKIEIDVTHYRRGERAPDYSSPSDPNYSDCGSIEEIEYETYIVKDVIVSKKFEDGKFIIKKEKRRQLINPIFLEDDFESYIEDCIREEVADRIQERRIDQYNPFTS